MEKTGQYLMTLAQILWMTYNITISQKETLDIINSMINVLREK